MHHSSPNGDRVAEVCGAEGLGQCSAVHSVEDPAQGGVSQREGTRVDGREGGGGEIAVFR